MSVWVKVQISVLQDYKKISLEYADNYAILSISGL